MRVYIDDSADAKKEVAIVAGAFIAPRDHWEQFSKDWRARLRIDGLSYFRSTEYYSLRGEFARYRDPVKYPKPAGGVAARLLREDLEAIIKKMGLVGMAVAIPLQMYHEVRLNEPGADQVFGPDAFEIALQTLIERCAALSKAELARTRLAFICDNGPSSKRVEQIYRNFKEANVATAKLIGSLTHGDDKELPPLQAADLMANLARDYYMNWLKDPTAVTLKRLKDSVYSMHAWDRDYMLRALGHEKKARGI